MGGGGGEEGSKLCACLQAFPLFYLLFVPIYSSPTPMEDIVSSVVISLGINGSGQTCHAACLSHHAAGQLHAWQPASFHGSGCLQSVLSSKVRLETLAPACVCHGWHASLPFRQDSRTGGPFSLVGSGGKCALATACVGEERREHSLFWEGGEEEPVCLCTPEGLVPQPIPQPVHYPSQHHPNCIHAILCHIFYTIPPACLPPYSFHYLPL